MEEIDYKSRVIKGAVVGKGKTCATLVIQLMGSHTNCVDTPSRITTHFLDNLVSTEQAYRRRVGIKDEIWVSLDLGWLANSSIGYLIVQNINELDITKKILVAVDGVTISSIRPGRFFNIEPEEGVASRIKLKAIGGDAQIFITAIPK